MDWRGTLCQAGIAAARHVAQAPLGLLLTLLLGGPATDCVQVDEHYYGTAMAVHGRQWETDCKGVLTSSYMGYGLDCSHNCLCMLHKHGPDLTHAFACAGAAEMHLSKSTLAGSSMQGTWAS